MTRQGESQIQRLLSFTTQPHDHFVSLPSPRFFQTKELKNFLGRGIHPISEPTRVNTPNFKMTPRRECTPPQRKSCLRLHYVCFQFLSRVMFTLLNFCGSCPLADPYTLTLTVTYIERLISLILTTKLPNCPMLPSNFIRKKLLPTNVLIDSKSFNKLPYDTRVFFIASCLTSSHIRWFKACAQRASFHNGRTRLFTFTYVEHCYNSHLKLTSHQNLLSSYKVHGCDVRFLQLNVLFAECLVSKMC